MNYLSITHCDLNNGDGIRCTLWVSGCNHNCLNCHNPDSHDPNNGLKFDDSAKLEIFKELDQDYCKGLTISGGDPMYPANRKEIIELCKEVKEKYPKKDIWMWTGYLLNELIDSSDCKDIFKYVDVIIDGPFKQELKDPDLEWKGSSNQVLWKIYQQDENRCLCMSDIKDNDDENAICNIVNYVDLPIEYIKGEFDSI